jgi:TonB family protein
MAVAGLMATCRPFVAATKAAQYGRRKPFSGWPAHDSEQKIRPAGRARRSRSRALKREGPRERAGLWQANVPLMKMPLRFAFAVAAVSWVGAAEPATMGYIPCRIVQKALATYPLRMINEGVMHGEAHVIVEIGTDGKISDALLAACTRREFGDEALASAKRWRFAPGLLDGQPVISIVNVIFNFRVEGVVAYEARNLVPRDEERLSDSFEYFPHGGQALDAPPSVIEQPPPAYLRQWIAEGREGAIVVEFYIDETGRPRMPVAIAPSDSFLAAAAVFAIKQWRFAPPKHRGQPVLAHAMQTFVFKAPLAPSPSS